MADIEYLEFSNVKNDIWYKDIRCTLAEVRFDYYAFRLLKRKLDECCLKFGINFISIADLIDIVNDVSFSISGKKAVFEPSYISANYGYEIHNIRISRAKEGYYISFIGDIEFSANRF